MKQAEYGRGQPVWVLASRWHAVGVFPAWGGYGAHMALEAMWGAEMCFGKIRG